MLSSEKRNSLVYIPNNICYTAHDQVSQLAGDWDQVSIIINIDCFKKAKISETSQYKAISVSKDPFSDHQWHFDIDEHYLNWSRALKWNR